MDGQLRDGRTNGRSTDGRLTDERGRRLTDERSGWADGRTGRRTEETDGLTKITGGLTDADGQADGWKGEGRTGGCGRTTEGAERWQRVQERELAGAAAAASTGEQWKRER